MKRERAAFWRFVFWVLGRPKRLSDAVLWNPTASSMMSATSESLFWWLPNCSAAPTSLIILWGMSASADRSWNYIKCNGSSWVVSYHKSCNMHYTAVAQDSCKQENRPCTVLWPENGSESTVCLKEQWQLTLIAAFSTLDWPPSRPHFWQESPWVNNGKCMLQSGQIVIELLCTLEG